MIKWDNWVQEGNQGYCAFKGLCCIKEKGSLREKGWKKAHREEEGDEKQHPPPNRRRPRKARALGGGKGGRRKQTTTEEAKGEHRKSRLGVALEPERGTTEFKRPTFQGGKRERKENSTQKEMKRTRGQKITKHGVKKAPPTTPERTKISRWPISVLQGGEKGGAPEPRNDENRQIETFPTCKKKKRQ